MGTVTYIKPSNKEIEVNDNEHTRNFAAINGWKKVEREEKRPAHHSNKRKQLDKRRQ